MLCVIRYWDQQVMKESRTCCVVVLISNMTLGPISLTDTIYLVKW